MKADTIERNAEKQNRYREANERIAQVLSKFAASGWLDKTSDVYEFFCECGQPGRCGEHVKVSAATYERVRSDPTTFILFPGHEAATVESTIERSEGFLISRNFGRAAEIARAADPRRMVKASLRARPNHLML